MGESVWFEDQKGPLIEAQWCAEFTGRKYPLLGVMMRSQNVHSEGLICLSRGRIKNKILKREMAARERERERKVDQKSRSAARNQPCPHSSSLGTFCPLVCLGAHSAPLI